MAAGVVAENHAGVECLVQQIWAAGFEIFGGAADIMSIQFKDAFGLKDSRPIELKEELPSGLFRAGQFALYRQFGKRLLDVVFVIAMAPIALPLILGVALLMALDGHRPFYRQERVGRDGKVFGLLKIRTMVPDADTQLEEYLRQHPEARREWNDKQKLDNDPRVTRLGTLLRQTSLDELPQLWNVLKGEMSIVGPRPMMVNQKSLYPGRAYYLLRPGITGLWQVSQRNESSFASRAIFDDRYQDLLSLKTDLHILVRTIGVVLRCTGR